MTEPSRQRPMRLWVAALVNITLGTLSLAAVAFLSLSTQIPDAFRTGAGNTAVFALSTGLLIAWSLLALMGKPWARHLMLAAALLFYGGILIQNIQLYRSAADAHLATAPLIAQVAGGVIPIAINLWALLSAKTRQYFKHASGAT